MGVKKKGEASGQRKREGHENSGRNLSEMYKLKNIYWKE